MAAQSVDVAEARRRIADGAVLLDVREPVEWDEGHAGEAVSVPMAALAPDTVPADVPLVVVCHSGRRSAYAADVLTANGYDAVNLEGGMIAWAATGAAVVRDDGSPGRVD